MGRRLIVTAAEVAAGWVVRPGVCPHKVLPCGGADCCCAHEPPYDLLDAAAPCGRCLGHRWVPGNRDGLDYGYHPDERQPCPDCRIELLGECPECLEGCDISTCCECGEDYTEPCPRHVAAGHVPSADPYDDGSECDSCCQRCHGAWQTVTLGYAYSVGGVLPIVGDGHALTGDYIEVLDGGEVYQRHMSDDDEITSTTFVADDPAWEALVGQYALRLEVVQ